MDPCELDKLREAMGWNTVGGNLFQPDTDANDDYAVLEWMRKQIRPCQPHGEPDWPYLNALGGSLQIDYHIGDYARTALKVLE